MNVLSRVSVCMVLTMALFMTACNDNPFTADESDATLQADVAQFEESVDLEVLEDADVAGRTIRNIELELLDEETGETFDFAGRITNLQLSEGSEPGTVVASGRLIGQLNGERINELFEGVVLRVFDLLGNLLDGPGVCQILYLEIAPIFLNVLGLIVEIPETVVVEIRAERGPGQLLGNLLCGLLGILDP